MKLKIGDDVIVSSKAGTNPGTTGTVIQFTEFESGFQYGTIYEVRYDEEQDLVRNFSTYPYFEKELELNFSKIRDKKMSDILE